MVAGLLSQTFGYEAKQNGYNVLAFQLSLLQYKDAERISSYLLKNSSGEVFVTITDEGNENLWEDVSSSYYSWIAQGILIVFSFIILIFAIYKLMIYFVIKLDLGTFCPFNNAEYVLSIEIISQLIRICYYAIDPVNIRSYTDYILTFYLFQITFPLGILSTILILIHWNHATSFESYIEKYRVLFFVLNIILIVFFVIVVPILFQFIDVLVITILLALILLIVTVFLSIYIFYTAPRVLRFVRKTLHNEKEIQQIEKKTRSIFISGVISIVWFLPIIVFLTELRGHPYVWFGLFFIWFLLCGVLSLVQISVFQPNIRDTRITSRRGSM